MAIVIYGDVNVRITLLKWYRSLIRSKFGYCSIVYGSPAKTSLAWLDPVHNQGLSLNLGAFRSSPVETLYVEASIINSQRKVKSTVYSQTKSQSSSWCCVKPCPELMRHISRDAQIGKMKLFLIALNRSYTTKTFILNGKQTSWPVMWSVWNKSRVNS